MSKVTDLISAEPDNNPGLLGSLEKPVPMTAPAPASVERLTHPDLGSRRATLHTKSAARANTDGATHRQHGAMPAHGHSPRTAHGLVRPAAALDRHTTSATEPHRGAACRRRAALRSGLRTALTASWCLVFSAAWGHI